MSYNIFGQSTADVLPEEITAYSHKACRGTRLQSVADNPSFMQEERRVEEIRMKLIMKEAEPVREPVREAEKSRLENQSGRTPTGERILTEDEIEEKRRFEEQKKLLEDRAERLRRMSFNIKGTDSNDEMEAVPAYMRKNMKLDNQAGSSDSYYSGYAVGMNDDPNNPQAVYTDHQYFP